MKKLYIISDIHGFYQEMIEALNQAGFDENNENHLLVSCGDAFDRGPNSLAIYNYLKGLEEKGKAIVLKGNHSLFLIDYLNGKNVSPFNYLRNGTDETLADFLHQTKPFETWTILNDIKEPTYGDFAKWISDAKKQINTEYPELLKWLETRPYYYETENYILTHGGIDTHAPDWHKPHCYLHHYRDWDACMWDDGSFFGKEIKNTDKTVVIGHFGTCDLREMYGLDFDKSPNEILKRDDGRVIAIDATTVLSHKVNVLVLEDNLLEG